MITSETDSSAREGLVNVEDLQRTGAQLAMSRFPPNFCLPATIAMRQQ